jgi:predicted transcriptional regulator
MTITLEISDSLKARIEAIAARSTMSPSEIVIDALTNGYSLEWLERALDRIERSKAQAGRGEFASAEDIERVVNKYRPS